MRHVLVHAHIFKNAGTTFDFSLSRFFGHDFVDHPKTGNFSLAGIITCWTTWQPIPA